MDFALDQKFLVDHVVQRSEQLVDRRAPLRAAFEQAVQFVRRNRRAVDGGRRRVADGRLVRSQQARQRD